MWNARSKMWPKINQTVLRLSVAMSILTTSLNGCGAPIPRPSHIPSDAEFVGGSSGGDWMKCEGTSDNVLRCKIYDPLNRSFIESWFRYCPALGPKETGVGVVLDWEKGLVVNDLRLRRDRIDIYHPDPEEKEEDIALQNELIVKYFELDGVDRNCNFVGRKSVDG